MDKNKFIKKELSKLEKIFKDIPKNKKDLCETLMQNAAFMSATLEELQQIINEEGAVKEYVNGNGFTTIQEHPAQKSYVNMVAKYTSIIAQLGNLLPDSKQDGINKAGEALASFIAKGKPKA